MVKDAIYVPPMSNSIQVLKIWRAQVRENRQAWRIGREMETTSTYAVLEKGHM
jgi:hypothetical protein